MANLEKIRPAVEKKEEEKSELLKTALNAKANFSSTSDAVSALSEKLQSIATRLGITVPALLAASENSSEFKEEYDEAASIARKIAFLKRK
jgi:predicted  nucleic acid-binding Zn-ribbon protein